jgi:hypothetical protein
MNTYIAGPMSGYPDLNSPLFRKVAAELRAAGIDVRNPAEHDHGTNEGWQFYMRHGIRLLLDCDAILLLPGWEDSQGARLEYDIACALGMRIDEYQPHDATQPESEAPH